MAQPQRNLDHAKTSTGLPVIQAFATPVAPANRPRLLKSEPSALERFFPEEMKRKRPYSETVKKSVSELAVILKDVANFPKFFEHLAKVEVSNSRDSSWHFESSEKIVLPMTSVSDGEGDLFVWKTQDAIGFGYTLAISLEEAPGDRGTIVRALANYHSKSEGLLAKLELLFGHEASLVAKKNLQRLKAYCEIGHVATIEGQPSGRDADSKILSASETGDL